MERLTKKNDSGGYYYPKCFEKCNGLGASSKCNNCEITTSVCEKLGKYEDLEEQGLLLRLPCKIGDTVWDNDYGNPCDNPLEPLKLQSALQSEIFKFNYRKEHKPQDINILDYTVMYALKHCLEEQLKAGASDGNG